MRPTPGRPGKIPPAIWALGFVSLLLDVSSELIHSLLPIFMVTVLGASALTVGLIEGAAEATALIVRVFSGVLSDYWGKRKPPDVRGAAFGLRQSLDTVGAFLGPLLAMGLMILWANEFRAVFWVAVVPAFLAVALRFLGVREPERASSGPRLNPIRRECLGRLTRAYWWVVAIGAISTLPRFSEAFLVLRAAQGGLPNALTPLVLIAMNVVYALAAYPFGQLSDQVSHERLLALGLVLLVAADAALAWSNHWTCVWGGITLWGLHMGVTQGLLATMVADTAPPDLRGTAYGFFHLVGGIAMLVASGLAGLLWDQLGAPATFLAGGGFCLVALLAVGAARLDKARQKPQ